MRRNKLLTHLMWAVELFAVLSRCEWFTVLRDDLKRKFKSLLKGEDIFIASLLF
jgi:hypothetical protein